MRSNILILKCHLRMHIKHTQVKTSSDCLDNFDSCIFQEGPKISIQAIKGQEINYRVCSYRCIDSTFIQHRHHSPRIHLYRGAYINCSRRLHKHTCNQHKQSNEYIVKQLQSQFIQSHHCINQQLVLNNGGKKLLKLYEALRCW